MLVSFYVSIKWWYGNERQKRLCVVSCGEGGRGEGGKEGGEEGGMERGREGGEEREEVVSFTDLTHSSRGKGVCGNY